MSLKEYTGNCHCKKISYNIICESTMSLLECDCSICKPTRYLHLIIPHKDFTLVKGKDYLKAYRFNTLNANHLFCKSCGIKSFYQPRSHKNCFSINYNCLVNPPKISEIVTFDGKDFENTVKRLNIK